MRPLTALLDDFNRADGPVGANWVASPAGDDKPAVATNQLAPLAAGSFSFGWWATDFGRNQECWFTLRALPAGYWLRVYLCYDNVGNSGYYADIQAGAATQLQKAVSGAGGDLSTSPGITTVAWAVGDKVLLRKAGSQLALSRYDTSTGLWIETPVLTGYDTALPATPATAAKVGVFISDGGAATALARIDDFGGGTLPVDNNYSKFPRQVPRRL